MMKPFGDYNYYVYVKLRGGKWVCVWGCDDYSTAYLCYLIMLALSPDYILILDEAENVCLKYSWLRPGK